jgi:hypothetical protein
LSAGIDRAFFKDFGLVETPEIGAEGRAQALARNRRARVAVERMSLEEILA